MDQDEGDEGCSPADGPASVLDADQKTPPPKWWQVAALLGLPVYGMLYYRLVIEAWRLIVGDR